MNKMSKGKFIVLYGINNLGKSTQAGRIADRLENEGIRTIQVKYADYGINPSGPLLNDYLRKGNKYALVAREFQLIQVINRMQVEPKIIKNLESGIWVVSEDYTGTGLAWGMGAGVDENFLEEINSHLLKEDIAILLEGERFSQGIEKEHKHEQDDDLTERVRTAHFYLAGKKGWDIVNANQDVAKVTQDIWEFIEPLI